MTDWLTYEGRIEPVEWGRATYTVLRVPPAVAEALEAKGARRVEGEINDHPVNLALSRAPVVDGVFMWTGRTLLSRLGLRPGDVFEVRLRPAPADAVETPDDLTEALGAAGQTGRWQDLTPGRRRGLLYRIDSARSAATRARRIAGVVAELASGAPDGAPRGRTAKLR
jgi:hypothetical protein